jgi:hypothetical protein
MKSAQFNPISQILIGIGGVVSNFAMRIFIFGWCPPDAWKEILPLLAQAIHAVDTIQSDDDG